MQTTVKYRGGADPAVVGRRLAEDYGVAVVSVTRVRTWAGTLLFDAITVEGTVQQVGAIRLSLWDVSDHGYAPGARYEGLAYEDRNEGSKA